MTIQEHIDSLRSTPSVREEERGEIYESIKEMEQTLGFLIVEVQTACVVVTQ